MRALWGGSIPHSFFYLALDEVEWSASCPAHSGKCRHWVRTWVDANLDDLGKTVFPARNWGEPQLVFQSTGKVTVFPTFSQLWLKIDFVVCVPWVWWCCIYVVWLMRFEVFTSMSIKTAVLCDVMRHRYQSCLYVLLLCLVCCTFRPNAPADGLSSGQNM